MDGLTLPHGWFNFPSLMDGLTFPYGWFDFPSWIVWLSVMATKLFTPSLFWIFSSSSIHPSQQQQQHYQPQFFNTAPSLHIVTIIVPDTHSSHHTESVILDAPKISNTILAVVKHLSEKINKFDEKIGKFDENFKKVHADVDGLKASNHQIQADIRGIKTEIHQIKTQTSETKIRVEDIYARQDQQALSETVRFVYHLELNTIYLSIFY